MRPAGLALKPTRTPRQASQQGLLLPPPRKASPLGRPILPWHASPRGPTLHPTPGRPRRQARPTLPPLGLALRPRPGPTPLPLASLGRGLPPADLAQGSPLSTPGKPRLEAHPSTQEGLTLRPTPPPLAGLGQDSPFPPSRPRQRPASPPLRQASPRGPPVPQAGFPLRPAPLPK
ncbi:hypothetical protein KY290_015700 [Solanum tuberosum]|uniref:Uncharacterized protein n=1 Tax=Solanum tuberosum TaxID=4113 RepID=A0ABQ7VVF2_SOLTU|nr:hypothetical protein KY285_015050 [Solanum tuberosum]KAH0771719.1 hypothetical protein KY290_015700 [Solanum tuberosum]